MSNRFLQRLSALILTGFFLIAVPAGLAHVYANGELDSDHGCAIGHFVLLTTAALLSVALSTFSIVPYLRLVASCPPVFDRVPLLPSSTRAPPA